MRSLLPPAILVSFLATRQKVKIASSAVNGLPLENVASLRSVKVHLLAPSFFHAVARLGIRRCASSVSTSASKMCAASALFGASTW